MDSIRSVHIARQALYTDGGDVAAYELLFRDAPDARRAGDRGPGATSRVIVAAFTEFGVEELVGDRPCLVNLTREFVVGDLPLPFEPGRIGLELLADIAVDDAVHAGAAALAAAGHPLVVDGFDGDPERARLLRFARYAKIDLLGLDADRVRAALRDCRRHPGLRVVAHRVETPELLTLARDLRFDLFQGHALSRPYLLTTHVLNPTRLARLRLLTELAADDVVLDRVVEVIERDPALALRVLRGVNTVATGLGRQVSSVFEAVVLLGTAQVRQWATLVAVGDLAQGNEELVSGAVIRARMCQTLAERRGENGQVAYTVGLLSAVSDLLGRPAAELTGQLPVTPDVADAVVHGRGGLGAVLTEVRAYQESSATASDLGGDLLAAMRWTTAATGTRPAAVRS